MSNIIGELASQFGIAPEQAESAAGSVLKFVQAQAGSGEFQQLLAALPQVQQWIARAGQASSAGGAGLLGQLGGLAASLGGEAGGIAGVLTALRHSGLKPDMIAPFVPALLQQLSAHVDPALVTRLMESVPALKELAATGGGSLGGLGGLLGGLGGSR
ncbi:DUF2780 domain-containing protein [Solimonas terrae]|uniref:DUF2780 domain-containing protein n=1 Tax=Solimonas terrae TaxID=1396819 RepID=A0A6M2BQV2_9GAMM|nr:DUF2780 domain-containing protein [Solimonas terrae]NGY04591.1 DUF2780 domain-containing protein [Solimonas terrae]